MPRTSEPGRSVGSRLCEILFTFGPDRRALSLADIARATGMSQATARRLTLELAAAGALDRGPDGRFTISLSLWRLGTLAPLTESLRSMAQPFLEDLYTALRQHVQLAVLEDDEAVIIERLSDPSALELISRVGGRLPLHCSGVGKVLLSHGSAELTGRVLSSPLKAYTSRTTTQPAVLRRELAECRRTGTAVVRGELTEGADSFAARVVNSDGVVVAAVSVIVNSGSVRAGAVLPALVTTAFNVSRQLGWRPGVKVRAGCRLAA